MNEQEPIKMIKPLPFFRPSIDYSYGLAIADMMLNVHQDGGLQLTLVMHNAADGPICFQFDKLEAKMPGCIAALKEPPKHKPLIVSRGMNSLYPCPPLKRMAVNTIPQISGKLLIAVKYGHPDEPPVRYAEWEIAVTVIIAAPQPRIFTAVESQSEKAITETMQ